MAFLCPLLIISTVKSTLLVYENSLTIQKKFVFGLFTKRKNFPYSRINTISYHGYKFNPLNLVYYLPGTNQEKGVQVTFKDSPNEEMTLNYGSPNDMQLVAKFIAERTTKEI